MSQYAMVFKYIIDMPDLVFVYYMESYREFPKTFTSVERLVIESILALAED